jgi:hypothetical protein
VLCRKSWPQEDKQGLEQSLANLRHADHDGTGDKPSKKLVPNAHLFLPAAAIKTKRMIRLQQMNWVTLQPIMMRNDEMSATKGILA